jgi:hypothetical protein
MKTGEHEEDGEGEGEGGDFEGGSKSFCNMVTQGYECDLDPSAEMGWGSWLEDRHAKECATRFGCGGWRK